jgi:hypothetical protein
MPSGREGLPFWARAADAGTLSLLALALFVAIEGGFVVWPAGIRVSVRSEWRVLIWAAFLLAARHFFVRERPLHRRVASSLAAAVRAAGPLHDDLSAASQIPERPVRSKRIRIYTIYVGAVVVFYAVLTAVMTYPQVRLLASAVSLDEGDALFSTWRLAWVAHQLPRGPFDLFDANIFHPERRALAFSDTMLVPALMASPLLWLGVPQLVVYNVVFLSAFALSGAAMFLLVRSLTQHNGASLLAGFVFAFLPYRFMHYAHLELQVAFWMPLCLWALHRTVRWARLRDGLLTGLFLALQTLSSWYYGIFLFTFLVPVGAAVLIAEGTHRMTDRLRALVAGGALAAALIVPLAIPYLAARESVGERPIAEIEFYSATPQNYMGAHSRNVLFGPLTSKWGGQERELFMGIVVPLVALIGLWPPLSAARIAYALGLVLGFDLSLGFNGMLYPWLHAYVLPYRGLRVPARMAMLVGLALAILFGYGAARLSRLAQSRHAVRATFVLLATLIFLEYRSRPVLKQVWTSPPPVYDALPSGSQNVLLELPLLAPDIALEPIYMYFSTFHWNRLANGYSGFSPPSYHQLLEVMARFPDADSVAELRRRGVTHVIVHGALYHPEDYADVVARIEQSHDFERVTVTRWARHETRAYRLLQDPWRVLPTTGMKK